jgi:UDP-N-acetylmuramate--alanine ligase
MDFINKHFHFIAIGGVGMSALAKYLAERGCIVSGSDIQESKYTHLLENIGVKVTIGHNADLVQPNMIVVASSAIKQNNVEIVRAKELGLKIYHRSDILKMISDEFSKRDNSLFIGFSGTHGKTTTSGLCSYILNKSGYKPSYVVGGIIPELNTNGEYNGEKFFCSELDESDGTIQKYSTDIAVINNMEEDHLDHYINGFPDIAETFNKYLSNKPNQKVIINTDDEGNKKFMSLYPNYKYITFGFKNADYTVENVEYKGFGSEFDIINKGKFLSHIKLSVLGKHNIYNALAVFSALIEAGIKPDEISEYFTGFSGMGRRFQKVCEFNNITIYDDYAHHPSEIKTTLAGAKQSKNANQKVVAIFQPHRYTRLQSLWNEFKSAFSDADELFITDVYSAGEDEILNVNSEKFSHEINHSNSKYVSGSIQDAAEKIFPYLKSNDIVITLGAGSITGLGKLLLNEHNKVIVK